MCGLAGVVTWDQRHRIDRALLARMSACIAHRGPDGSGQYINHDQLITSQHPQCGLVHRRLAIIDLDDRALQPFHDGTKRQLLVFNGEIYNYKALRAEVSSALPGYRWRTQSDTEALLASYLAFGGRCVDKLEGMFAFAVWDEPSGTLFLARDRMGQKPLYYAAVGADGKAWEHERPPMVIAFASELSSLRQTRWMDSTLNRSGLIDYLRFGYVPTPATIYNGGWKLPPGTWMKISAQGVEMERYFDPNRPASLLQQAGAESNEKAPPAEAGTAEKTRELLTQAVKRQLVADVPLGCFLSGGIDSSIIAAAMKQAVPKNQPVLTFSIGFDDPLYDETQFAANVANHLGTVHRQFTVQIDAASDLPKLARVFGEPFGDSSALPTHYLSRESVRYVKVALSGDGGDELFGGYDRYRAMSIGERLRRLPAPLRWIMASRLWQNFPGSHPKAKLTRLKRLLATLRQSPAGRYESYVRLFNDAMLKALLLPNTSAEAVIDYAAIFNEQMKGTDAIRAAAAVDRITYLSDDLLTKLDRSSMLHALEVRSPFMDHTLVHFAAGLSTAQLLEGGGKRMLREAFAKDFPAEVFNRPKMGFAVPIGDWLRGNLKEMLRDTLFAGDSFASKNFSAEFLRKLIDEHQAGAVDHSQRLYALLMLELWWNGEREP